MDILSSYQPKAYLTSKVSHDPSRELGFPFFYLGHRGLCSFLPYEEAPFHLQLADYLAINNTVFLVSPQHQTSLACDILCSVSHGRAHENLTCISLACLYILCVSILMLKIRGHFPLVVPTIDTNFCLKQRKKYIKMILCPSSQPLKQKHMKGIKSF